MRGDLNAFSAYLQYIGDGHYQAFIKNMSADIDFIRIAIGYTEKSGNV